MGASEDCIVILSILVPLARNPLPYISGGQKIPYFSSKILKQESSVLLFRKTTPLISSPYGLEFCP